MNHLCSNYRNVLLFVLLFLFYSTGFLFSSSSDSPLFLTSSPLLQAIYSSGDGGVLLNWQPQVGATDYQVRVGTNPENYVTVYNILVNIQ